MLQILRNSVGSIFVKVLFVLLVLSFAVWGMGDIFSGGFFGNTVAEVGRVKITAPQIHNEYQQELNRLRRMNINAEQARQMGLLDRVVQNMVSRASFDAEAMERGLTASDANIAREIRSNPTFRGGIGSFDRIQFERILRSNGLTEDMYVEQLRQDIARNQALESISTTIQVPKPVADTIYNWREEKRVAGILNVAPDATAAVGTPTDAEIKDYHKTNEAQFIAPERRAVRYLHLSATEFAKRIDISEDELLAAFEERATEFAVPETRKVLQMVVSSQDQAGAAKSRLSSGEDFAVVAKDIADQTAESIDLGEISKGDLPAELSPDVFALSGGAVSEPLKGPFGWHIFKVEKINEGREAKLSDVRDRLVQELSTEKAVDDVYRTANKLEDAFGAGSTIGNAASNLGLELKEVSAVDANGLDASGKPIPGLPGAPFLETTFSSGVDEPGTLIESEQDGGFFVLQVSSITPAALQPVEQVRAKIISAWQRQKRLELAEAKAKTIAESLERGRELRDIPEAAAESLVSTRPFTRQSGPTAANLPVDVVNQLFELKSIGKTAVGRVGGRFVVAKLLEIQSAQPSRDVEGFRGMAQNLRASMSSDILYQYNQALRDSYGAAVNNALLEQLFTDNNNYATR